MTTTPKNIVLTGSEGLIGRSFRKFAEKKGHKVFCLDLKNIRRKNYYRCDITDENSVIQTIKSVLMKSKVDVLINNASSNPKVEGKLSRYKFSNYSYEIWKKGLSVDLNGSFLMSKHLLKHFEKKNKGIILNISSIYSLVGPNQNIYAKNKKKYFGTKPIEYSVAKSGILGFTKSLAAFYSGTDIKVNCLVFGGVKNKKQDHYFSKNYSNKTIMLRMASANEYNEYIEFFISEKNTYTTGSNFIIDGGATNII